MTFFEATNSVSNKTDENNSLSNTIHGHWDSESAERTINELNKLIELRSQNGTGLHVKEVRKRGNKRKMGAMIIKYQTLILIKKRDT